MRSSDVRKTKATSDSNCFGPRIDFWDSPQSEILMLMGTSVVLKSGVPAIEG